MDLRNSEFHLLVTKWQFGVIFWDYFIIYYFFLNPSMLKAALKNCF